MKVIKIQPHILNGLSYNPFDIAHLISLDGRYVITCEDSFFCCKEISVIDNESVFNYFSCNILSFEDPGTLIHTNTIQDSYFFNQEDALNGIEFVKNNKSNIKRASTNSLSLPFNCEFDKLVNHILDSLEVAQIKLVNFDKLEFKVSYFDSNRIRSLYIRKISATRTGSDGGFTYDKDKAQIFTSSEILKYRLNFLTIEASRNQMSIVDSRLKE